MEESDFKEKIAKEFLTDSNDFLKRFQVLFESSLNGHIGMRSKLLIDLIFSAECSIKGLIFLESHDTEVYKIYKKIFTHKLGKLLDNLPYQEKQNCLPYIDPIILDYDVGNRYMIEAYKTYRPNGWTDQKYYNTIANYQWLNSVYEKLVELEKYVWGKVKVKIETFSFNELDVDKMINEHKMIMELKK